MASKMKDRKVRAPCALCIIRTDLFWQRGTFNTFQLLCGILYFGIFHRILFNYNLESFSCEWRGNLLSTTSVARVTGQLRRGSNVK